MPLFNPPSAGSSSTVTGFLPRKLLSGKYVALLPGVVQSLTMSRGFLYVWPFEVFESTSFVTAEINVSTGQTSCVGRIGVYANNLGLPGTLAFEATAGATQDWSTTGQKTTVISQTLAAGIYWGACRAEGGSADPVVSGTQQVAAVISSSTFAGAAQNACSGYADGGGGSGALTTVGALSQTTVVPRVVFKTA